MRGSSIMKVDYCDATLNLTTMPAQNENLVSIRSTFVFLPLIAPAEDPFCLATIG